MNRNFTKQLNDIYQYLVPLWNEIHEAEEHQPETPDQNMCRYTALFIVKCLGSDWRVEGGEDWYDFTTNKPLPGGILQKDGTRAGHYWATNGKVIVDLTSKQFGYPPIVVHKDFSERYLPNYSKGELREHLKHVRERVNNWMKGFEPDWEMPINPKIDLKNNLTEDKCIP